MTTGGRLGNVLHYIRKLGSADDAPVADLVLLRRFVRDRDEAAFAALVERHRTMVSGVCWRVLGRSHDVEDAFQATFLVLVRRASSVRGSVGGWLHAVAYRVACRLRASLARRPAQELEPLEVPQPDITTDVSWREVRQVLDEELNRLPEKYRAPLVLCYLEGMTQDEAARQLGWRCGVLRGRLDRGRERLRVRLTRRGLAYSTAMLGAVLAESVSGSIASAALVVTTVRAALLIAAGRVTASSAVSTRIAKLAEEVTRAMFLTKMRTAMLMMLAVLASVSVALGYQALGGQRPNNAVKSHPQSAATTTRESAKPVESDTPKIVAKLSDIGEVLEPDTLEIRVGGMCLLVFKQAARLVELNRRTKPIAASDMISLTQVAVGGVRPGTTTWEFWFEEPSKAKRDQILSLRIHVLAKNEQPKGPQRTSDRPSTSGRTSVPRRRSSSRRESSD